MAYIIIHFISTKSSNQFSANEANEHLKSRNKRLQRKITLIIMTDFCCWIPFIVMCFLHSVEVTDASPYYSLFSIIVLPINSVINPLLYDDTIGVLLSKMFTVLSEPFRTNQKIGDQKNVTVTTTPSTNMTNKIGISASESVSCDKPKVVTARRINVRNIGDAQNVVENYDDKHEENSAENLASDLKLKHQERRLNRKASVIAEILNEEKPKLEQCKKWQSQGSGNIMAEEAEYSTDDKNVKRTLTESRLFKSRQMISNNFNSRRKRTLKSIKRAVSGPCTKASRSLLSQGSSNTAERTSERTATPPGLDEESDHVYDIADGCLVGPSGQVGTALEMSCVSGEDMKDKNVNVQI